MGGREVAAKKKSKLYIKNVNGWANFPYMGSGVWGLLIMFTSLYTFNDVQYAPNRGQKENSKPSLESHWI